MGVPDFTNSKPLDEAADKIERLQQRVAELQAQCGYMESIAAVSALKSDDEVRRLREAVAVLLNGIGGHHHWDAAGTSGANCPVCQRQQEAMIRARELVSSVGQGSG